MTPRGDARTLLLAPALLLTTFLMACSSDPSGEAFAPSLTVPPSTTFAATTTTEVLPASTPPGSARWSSTIVASPDSRVLYVANPDSGSATAVHTDGRVLWETTVGRDPTTLTLDPLGNRLFVAVAGENQVAVLDSLTGEEASRLDTHRQPRGVLVTPDGRTVIVSSRAENTLDLFDAISLESQGSVDVGADPWGLAMPVDGDTAYVTHLFTGDLSVIALDNRSVTAVITTGPENNASRHVALHPDGRRAYLPLMRSRTSNADLDFETTIMPRVPVVDLEKEQVITRELLGLDAVDQPVNMPSAVAFSPDGEIAYVVNAGSNDISVIDLDLGFGVGHIEVGTNPRGIVVSKDGSTAYVHNVLSDDISVVDLTTLEEIRRIKVTTSPLPPDVLAGKILFNGSFRTEMARDQWITCASCHLDGDIDGRTWPFDDGPRNTPPVRGLAATFPFHWSGDRVDLFDFQKTIIDIQAGTGLSDEENEQLAAFLGFREVPPSPFPVEDTRGAKVFDEAGCATCHADSSFTDGLRHDMGTADGPDETKGPMIDTPTLLGLFDTPPYLHDGSAPTLRDVFESAPATSPHGLVRNYSEVEIGDLLAYLRSLPQG
ncbi:MAG: beta-propeller fold lactonase family protein [Acidimicrobiia bacterium]|nr:beta-propeller fold lactonase family protein [Actinomycetota bacterium]MBL6927435.1 beta-propeller fold lactonase family protein [Acidimicrobiia bacterium]